MISRNSQTFSANFKHNPGIRYSTLGISLQYKYSGLDLNARVCISVVLPINNFVWTLFLEYILAPSHRLFTMNTKAIYSDFLLGQSEWFSWSLASGTVFIIRITSLPLEIAWLIYPTMSIHTIDLKIYYI